MKNAPHPSAAILFADFLTSKDGLIPYAESRGTAVNAPALEKFARANKDLKEMGLTFEVLPYRFMSYSRRRRLAEEYKLQMMECAELCRSALNAHTTPVSRIIFLAVKMLKRQNAGYSTTGKAIRI